MFKGDMKFILESIETISQTILFGDYDPQEIQEIWYEAQSRLHGYRSED